VKTDIPEKDLYINTLSSLHAHLSSGNPLETWRPNGGTNALSEVLSKYADADNHGVKSSFSLLKQLQKAFGENAFNPCYVEAALGIAVHDRPLHGHLLKSRVFPMNIVQFPLPCLLLYCDAMEEWGRKQEYDPEVRLVDLKIQDNMVCCDVAFDRNYKARGKISEITDIMKCIQSPNISFAFSPRVYASS
jgi:hypothetical protein